jgi:thymidylate synthase (FAD)
MSQIVEPQVFLIGESKVIRSGLEAYLGHIGVPDWDTDANSDAEELTEIYGRMCYRSFEAGLNPNLKKVTEGNHQYNQRIISSKHGSVLESSVLNFIITDTSRVMTHELCRHRVGTHISQESLRFVRLDKLTYPMPPELQTNTQASKLVMEAMETLEKVQIKLAEIYDIDDLPFAEKKKLTSAFRRIAPIGLGTAIGWSTNIRTLRHILEMRTAPFAEWEIRFVFGKIGEIVRERYPSFFADYTITVDDGLPWYQTEHGKV